MKYIDLTHVMEPEMPVFPGTEQPVFETPVTVEQHGFLETKFHMYSHTGTHMDAPAHMIKDALYLNQMPIEQYCGPAVIIDVSDAKGSIGRDLLTPFESMVDAADFVILKTGWSQYWGQDRYFEAFPCLSLEATEWLVSKKLKGIGLDAISIDPVDSKDSANHFKVFENGMIIIENLTNLELVPTNQCQFFCFPLSFKNSDGSPVRAVAAY